MIEDGRDPDRLGDPSDARRQLARAKLGSCEPDEILVNVGRQVFAKGQSYLLEAIEKLAPRRPRLRLLIAGRCGEASPTLARSCERPVVRDRVRLLGHREDIPEILAAADLFVFPSQYEGLPGAVIEAMALGLPIVASDIAPHRELLEEGRNALLVRRDSAVELAAAIETLLKDRETARAFGKRSREIFADRFTLHESTRRKVELYHELVLASRRHAADE